MTSGDVRSQVLVVMMVGYRLSPYRPRAVVFVDVGACKGVACPGGHAAAMDGKERYTVDYIPASVRAGPLRQCRRFCTSGLQNWLRVGCLGDGRVRDGGVRLINTARGVTSLAATSLRWMRVATHATGSCVWSTAARGIDLLVALRWPGAAYGRNPLSDSIGGDGGGGGCVGGGVCGGGAATNSVSLKFCP